MAAKDDLARYLTNVEEQTEPVDVAQVGERVEALLTELGLPWSIDEEADWEIKSDVGTVFARLEGGTVWIFQHVHELEEKSKKYADYFRSLLVLNGNVSGAAFAIFGGPGDTQCSPSPLQLPLRASTRRSWHSRSSRCSSWLGCGRRRFASGTSMAVRFPDRG